MCAELDSSTLPHVASPNPNRVFLRRSVLSQQKGNHVADSEIDEGFSHCDYHFFPFYLCNDSPTSPFHLSLRLAHIFFLALRYRRLFVLKDLSLFFYGEAEGKQWSILTGSIFMCLKRKISQSAHCCNFDANRNAFFIVSHFHLGENPHKKESKPPPNRSLLWQAKSYWFLLFFFAHRLRDLPEKCSMSPQRSFRRILHVD